MEKMGAGSRTASMHEYQSLIHDTDQESQTS